MTTPQGLTVYTFDKDQMGKSTCYADCATQWPPMIADDNAPPYGRMSLASRDDGQRQWAYDDEPLYTYAEDEMYGDVMGENVGNIWQRGEIDPRCCYNLRFSIYPQQGRWAEAEAAPVALCKPL